MHIYDVFTQVFATASFFWLLFEFGNYIVDRIEAKGKEHPDPVVGTEETEVTEATEPELYYNDEGELPCYHGLPVNVETVYAAWKESQQKQYTDAELIRIAKERKLIAGCHKWSYKRVLSDSIRQELLRLAAA